MTKERILLEEPELPAVDITGPITVTDDEIAPVTQEEEVSEETTKDAFISLIANEIANNYSSIDSFKSIKNTLTTSTLDDSLKESVSEIIEGIIDNRTLEIGMFQTILEQLDPDMKELISDGKSVAEEETQEEKIELE